MIEELNAIIEQAKRTEYSYWKIDLANAKAPLTKEEIFKLNGELCENVAKLRKMKEDFLEKYNSLD